MLFVSYNVLAEEGGKFPDGRSPAPEETNPMQVHAAANGRASVQTAIVKPGSATSENRVNNDDCPFCQTNTGINESTDVEATQTIGPDGKPIKSNK